MTKDELLKTVDSLTIHEKDYDIILKLLNYGDNCLFSKILEEVVRGNLYWSDFEELFSDTNYPEFLSKSLQDEHNLGLLLSSLISLRRALNSSYEYDQNSAGICLANDVDSSLEEYIEYKGSEANRKYNQLYTLSTNGYSKATKYSAGTQYYIKTSEKIDGIYTDSYNKMRNAVLRSLSKPDVNDTILLRTIKNTLYTYVKNGDYLLKNPSAVSDITESTFKKDKIEYKYIDINTIFAFLKSYYMPIEYSFISLNEFDKVYMNENNLTEEETKQIKYLYYFLMKSSPYMLSDIER